MSVQAKFNSVDRTLTIRIPIALRKRGGRKRVIAPDGAVWAPPRARIDNAMIKALARAFRWRKQLESGVHGSIEELAKAEQINPSYVSRVLRLTLLAPTIIEAILDGRQPMALQLDELLALFPFEWDRQCRKFKVTT